MQAMTTTIKDIAKRAGVSIATVSYVVNGTRAVSPELTRRVTEAIHALGYSPNANARSLRQQRTRTIGLICPDNANPFFAEIAKGVEDAGFAAGYSVILCNSDATPTRELTYLDLLRSKRVDGIIFIATTAETEQIRPVLNAGIPAVLFYRDPDDRDLDVDVLKIDNEIAGYTATRYLIEQGHRSIACIQPLLTTTPSSLRVEGFLRALAEAELAPQPRLMPRGDNRLGGGAEAARKLVRSRIGFTAVLACNDAMAIGAMRTFRDAGLDVPTDVSVVGIDDILLSSFVNPALTTVAQPKHEAGRQAVSLLIERMEGRHEKGPRVVTLETELVVRSSSGPPRMGRQ